MASKTITSVEQDRSDMNCLDILAGVVSNCSHSLNTQDSSSFLEVKKTTDNDIASRSTNPQVHRVSCHRCGNLRRKIIVCERPQCPHIFCGRCADKMKSEYGADVFARGCPVCQELCCCVHKSVDCDRKNHCYRKCPASKNTDSVAKVNTLPCENHNHSDNGGNQQNSFHLKSNYLDTSARPDGLSGFIGFPRGEQSGHSMSYHAEQGELCLSKHGSLDFLAAAVSIIDSNERLNFVYHHDSQVLTDHHHEHGSQDGSRKRMRESEESIPSSKENSSSSCSTADGYPSYTDSNKEITVGNYFGVGKKGNSGILHSNDSKQHSVYFLDQNVSPQNLNGEKLDSHAVQTTNNGRESLQLPSIPIQGHESHELKQDILNHKTVPSYLQNEIGEIQKQKVQSTNNQFDHNQHCIESPLLLQQQVITNSREQIFNSLKNNREEPYSIHGTSREFQYPSTIPGVSDFLGNIPSQILPPPL